MLNHLFVDEVPLHKHLTVYLSHDGKMAVSHHRDLQKGNKKTCDPEKIFTEAL